LTCAFCGFLWVDFCGVETIVFCALVPCTQEWRLGPARVCCMLCGPCRCWPFAGSLALRKLLSMHWICLCLNMFEMLRGVWKCAILRNAMLGFKVCCTLTTQYIRFCVFSRGLRLSCWALSGGWVKVPHLMGRGKSLVISDDCAKF